MFFSTENWGNLGCKNQIYPLGRVSIGVFMVLHCLSNPKWHCRFDVAFKKPLGIILNKVMDI